MTRDRFRVAGLTGLVLLISSSVALPLVADDCSGVAAYVSGTVYTGGQQAVYNSQLWKAKWWTQNETPSTGGSGVWQFMADCGGGGGNTTPAGYTWCANENGSYTFGQTVDVAYGANGVYVYKTGVSGAITFNNATFGDPISGVAKAGYYKASTAVGPAGYTWCAAENGSYTFNTAVDVAYGANGSFVYKTGVTGAITFDNGTFGDPAFGVAKAGYYKDASNVGPAGYTWCAGENGSYTFSQAADVAFGANGSFFYKTGITGAITFNNATFGDPIPGIVKAGYYKNSGGNTTTLPKRIMSGYWHSWGGGAGFIKLRDVNSSWDVINISFAEPVSPGSTTGQMKFAVTGDASYSDADFKADIKSLQAKGKKIVLSIGGYEGYFSLTSSSAVSTFVSAIKGFVSAYGFDGIDIDLEQSSVQLNSGADPDFKNPTSPKVVNLISAIRQICDAFGSNFILSWAPETFYLQMGFQYYAGINQYVDARAGDYIPLIHALRDKTTYVQAQLYNSGAILAPDGGYYTMGDAASVIAMCKMLLTGFNVNNNPSYFFPALRPDQVVIGVPASGSAAGSGLVPNATLQQAFGTLNSSYPGLRGIMAWSINWDNFQNGNSFATSNRNYLNTLP